jgi:acyl-CoA thioester hydrolase
MSLVSTAARPHPDRLSPALYPVRSTIEARFGDMDANRHLNNLALEAMHDGGPAPIPEEARTRLAALLLAESGPISMGV